MSLPPCSTPFLKIDQNGSDAWPWVTTSMLIPARSGDPAPPLAAGVAVELEQADATSAKAVSPIAHLVSFIYDSSLEIPAPT
jgi:hypothetical protein